MIREVALGEEIMSSRAEERKYRGREKSMENNAQIRALGNRCICWLACLCLSIWRAKRACFPLQFPLWQLLLSGGPRSGVGH